MTILQIVVIMLMLLGVIFFIWIILAGIFWLYTVWEKRKLRLKIPEEIKKEVENERLKREATRQQTGRGYAVIAEAERRLMGTEQQDERDDRSIPNPRDNYESESIQPMGNEETRKPIGRNKPTGRGFKFRRI